MRKILLFGFLTTILILFSCEKKNDNNASIVGKWKWVMSSYSDYGSLKPYQHVNLQSEMLIKKFKN